MRVLPTISLCAIFILLQNSLPSSPRRSAVHFSFLTIAWQIGSYGSIPSKDGSSSSQSFSIKYLSWLPRMKIQFKIVFNFFRVASGSGPRAKQSPKQMIWSILFFSSIIAIAFSSDDMFE